MDKPNDLHLGTLAVESKLLTQEQLNQALEDLNRRSEGTLAVVLLSKGLLSSQQINYLRSLTWTEQGQVPTEPERIWIPAPHGSFGKYTLRDVVGKGGGGVVYEAEDPQLRRKVALKVFRPSPMGDPEREIAKYERFLRESRLVANLPRHPHIVSVYEAGFHNDLRYLAMEFVNGRQMNDWWGDASVTREQVVGVISQVASAIHHAHEHGVIHRDLKPQNILIDAAGRPMITDFGLAKNVEEDAGPTVTDAHQAMGTPAYMSPEQARGMKAADRRTDVYALGVILYEALTGVTPFRGDSSVDVLIKVVSKPIVNPSELTRSEEARHLSRSLDHVCVKALAKEADDRYPTAQALADDILRSLEGKPIEAAKNAMPARLGIAAAALILVATLVAISFMSPKDSAPPTEVNLHELLGQFQAVRSADPLFLRYADASKFLERARKAAGPEQASVDAMEEAYRKEYRALVLGHWPLREGNAEDRSAYGQHGILHGEPNRTPEGLRFDGKNDLIELPNAPHLDRVQDGSYTLSAWYKPLAFPPGGSMNEEQASILMKTGQHGGLSYDLKGRYLMTHWYKDDAPLLAMTWDNFYPPGRWSHLVGTVDKDSGVVELYVDGVRAHELRTDPGRSSLDYRGAPWRIGIGNPAGEYYRWAAAGIIRNVRMFGRALDETEVRALHAFEADDFPSTPGEGDLTAHWTLDDDGDVAKDDTSYGNDALRVGDPQPVPGVFGQALRLDGKDSYLRVRNSPSLNQVTRGPYTVSAWFKPDENPAFFESGKELRGSIVTFASFSEGLSYTNARGFVMGHHLADGVWAGTNTQGGAHPPGRLYHVMGVVDPAKGSTRLYVNGELASKAEWPSDTEGLDHGLRAWRIGMAEPYLEESDRRGALKGTIDDVRIYSRALSAEEARELHAEGRRSGK